MGLVFFPAIHHHFLNYNERARQWLSWGFPVVQVALSHSRSSAVTVPGHRAAARATDHLLLSWTEDTQGNSLRAGLEQACEEFAKLLSLNSPPRWEGNTEKGLCVDKVRWHLLGWSKLERTLHHTLHLLSGQWAFPGSLGPALWLCPNLPFIKQPNNLNYQWPGYFSGVNTEALQDPPRFLNHQRKGQPHVYMHVYFIVFWTSLKKCMTSTWQCFSMCVPIGFTQ